MVRAMGCSPPAVKYHLSAVWSHVVASIGMVRPPRYSTVSEERSNPFSSTSNTRRPGSESEPPWALANHDEPESVVGHCNHHFDRPVTGLRPDGITVRQW